MKGYKMDIYGNFHPVELPDYPASHAAGAPAPMDSVAIGSLLIPTQTLGAPVVRSLRKDTNRRPTKTAT